MTLNLRVQLFADGANLDDMIAMSRRPYIRGFTTNPTLMRQAGVCDYATFARDALAGGAPSNISVFAGRIADTGRDPVPVMAEAVDIAAAQPQVKLIWASPRELLNIFQADQIGCPIITVTTGILNKLDCVGKDLDAFSLETVKMFHGDAMKAGFTLKRQAQLT